MSKAEERALEAYPPHIVGDPTMPYGEWDVHGLQRRTYQEAYEQAEKDLGWHSVEESLPPIDEEVIVLTNEMHGHILSTACHLCYGHIVDTKYCVDYNGWNIPGVKYWMPRPKIPNEDE